MSEVRYLTNLKEGARLCRDSAERLLQDAKLLFQNGKHQSSYLLSQLSIEEQAKAFKLIDKHFRRKTFSIKEWKDFAYSHEEKIRYIQSLIDSLDAKMVKAQTGIDYWQVLKKMYQGQGEKSLERYRKRIARELTKFRFAKLYTDYDFENSKWIEINQKDGVFSLRSMHTAERLLNFLGEILRLDRNRT